MMARSLSRKNTGVENPGKGSLNWTMPVRWLAGHHRLSKSASYSKIIGI